MKRINKKLLEALDKLIAKYSGEELEYRIDYMGCPLCDLFFKEDYPIGKECTKCPNTYFGGNIGCSNRAEAYEKLNYTIEARKDNYPTLKQFWTDYKSLYLQRKYSNSEIMEILIVPFKRRKEMKSLIYNLLSYLIAFPVIMIIVDVVKGGNLKWLNYLKFDIGIVIGGTIAIFLIWILEKVKINIYIKVVLYLISFPVVLGLLIRFNLLNFLK